MGEVGTIADVERELVVRIAAGDRPALEDLYERYRGPLFAYLRVFTTDRGLAEEVIQDTLLAVWTGATGFRGYGSVRAWLFGIARNRLIDALRQRRLPVTNDAVLTEMPDTEPGPERLAIAQATHEELTAAFNRLAALHREILVLALVDGLSYPELADVLGIPLGTVKSRLSNAKRALRPALRQMEIGEP